MTDYLIFGFVDNGIMLLGALYGLHIEKYLPKKYQTGLGAVYGAGFGNAVSDWAGGMASLNYGLAFGSFIGCMVALALVPALLKAKKLISR
jgi:ABC-type Fe3+-siderophore transport system permease subunit